MKLPWKVKEEIEEKEEEIEELEQKMEELEDEKSKWKQKFEAEKDRRSELSRKKQEAEKQVKRLKEKLEQEESEVEVEEKDVEELKFEDADFPGAKKVLRKLGSMEAGEKELVTVYSPGKVEELSDLKSLKNSVSRQHYSELRGIESFVAFIDPELGAFILKMSPFFGQKVSVGTSFETGELLEFLESEKYWCAVSAGESFIFREEDGKVEEVERVKSRVDKEHSKGGFSQGRFERKRDEQVESHLEQVEGVLEEYDEVYILGDERFCEDLPGNYIGGFDPNRNRPEQFYRFQFGTAF